MDKFQLLKEFFVLTTLCGSLYSRFVTNTKKAFMNLTLHMHRAFNSMYYEELLNLKNFIFSSQTLNGIYMLGRTLSTVASILTGTPAFSYPVL